MEKKITDTLIKRLPKSKNEQEIHDTVISGLTLRVLPSGRMTFTVRYIINGSRKRHTIGNYPVVSISLARQEATKALQAVQKGYNPSAKHGSPNMAVSQLCDFYQKNGANHKEPSTKKIDAGRINTHIKPLIGHITLSNLTKLDVQNMMNDIINGKNIKVKGGKTTARDTVGLLSVMLNFAIDQRWLKENVAYGIKKPPVNMYVCHLNPKELADLGSELSKPKNQSHARNVLYLLLLTGCRRDEIASLKWDDVDNYNQCLNLSHSKVGARVVPIGKVALDFIQKLPKFNSHYIFPSLVKNKYYVGTPKRWRQIRKEANIPTCRIHGLRHTFASIAASLGYNDLIIGALLGHSKGRSTTSRYIHPSSQSLQMAATKISDTIAGQLGVIPKNLNQSQSQNQNQIQNQNSTP